MRTKHLPIAILLLICNVHLVHAQSPELDSLRARWALTPASADAGCDLCEAFAQYEMIDSVVVCIDRVRQLDLGSAQTVKLLLTEATAHSTVMWFEPADSCYTQMLDVLRSEELPYPLVKRAYRSALTFYKYFTECTSGLNYAEEYRAMCTAHDDPEGTLEGLMFQAVLQMCSDTAVDVSALLDSADSMVKTRPRLSGLYHELLGDQHYYMDHLSEAAAAYLYASQAYRNVGNEEGLHRVYLAFGDLYQDLGHFKRSLEYFCRVLPHLVHQDMQQLGTIYNSIGWSYYHLSQLDSALHYFYLSKRAHLLNSPSNPEVAYPLGNLGLTYRKLNHLDSALKYSQEAIPLFEEIWFMGGVAEAENNIGFVLLKQGKGEQAILRFKKALKLSREYEDPFEEMNAHEGLYLFYRDRDPAKALGHLEQCSRLKSETLAKDEALEAQQQETELLLNEHQQRIEALELKTMVQSLEIDRKNMRLLFYSIGFAVILAFGLLLTIYWFSRRQLLHQLEMANDDNQRIISMISHDFRGPISNIALMLEMMQRGDLEKDEFNQLTRDLYRQSSDISLLFDSFLGWAISQADGYEPNLTTFNWREVVEEMVSLAEPLARIKGVTIISKFAADVEIRTDRMAASLILRNILANAIKYSFEESKIIVDYTKEGNRVLTTIQDFGTGMAPLELEHLNNPKGSKPGTHREYGSGMGLRMASQFAQVLGGRISAISEPEKGSTFNIDLPA